MNNNMHEMSKMKFLTSVVKKAPGKSLSILIINKHDSSTKLEYLNFRAVQPLFFNCFYYKNTSYKS